MNDYGFNAALCMALELYDLSNRDSGRTTRMLEVVTDFDLIICETQQNKNYLERAIKNINKKTTIVIHNPNESLRSIENMILSKKLNKVFFDHEYIRKFTEIRIKSIKTELDHFTKIWSRENTDRDITQTNNEYRMERNIK